MRKILEYAAFIYVVFCTGLVTGFILSVFLSGGELSFGNLHYKTIGLIKYFF